MVTWIRGRAMGSYRVRVGIILALGLGVVLGLGLVLGLG